jgi:hypothetical protein
MSRHVVLLRRDPSLGLALRALLHGSGRVTELINLQAWSSLQADTVDAVVIDLPVPRRMQAVELVRSHFKGRLVLVLDPIDDPAAVPSHHDCSVVQRPFEIVELWHLVTTDPTPTPGRDQASARGRGPAPAGERRPAAPPTEERPAASREREAAAKESGLAPGANRGSAVASEEAPGPARPTPADASTWRWRGRRYGPATAIPPDPTLGGQGATPGPGGAKPTPRTRDPSTATAATPASAGDPPPAPARSPDEPAASGAPPPAEPATTAKPPGATRSPSTPASPSPTPTPGPASPSAFPTPGGSVPERPSMLRRLTGRLGGRKAATEVPEAPTQIRSSSVPAFEPAPPPTAEALQPPPGPAAWPPPTRPVPSAQPAAAPATPPTAAEPEGDPSPDRAEGAATAPAPGPAPVPPEGTTAATPPPRPAAAGTPPASKAPRPASASRPTRPERPSRPERPARPERPTRPAAESRGRPAAPRDPAVRGDRRRPTRPTGPAVRPAEPAPQAPPAGSPRAADPAPSREAPAARQPRPPEPASAPGREDAPQRSTAPTPPAAAEAVPDDPQDAVAAVAGQDDELLGRTDAQTGRVEADQAAVPAATASAGAPHGEGATPPRKGPEPSRRPGGRAPEAAETKARPGTGPLGVPPDAPEVLLAAEEAAGAPPGPTPGTPARPLGSAPPAAEGDPATGVVSPERRNRGRRARSLLRFTAPRRPEHPEREADAPDAATPLADFDRLTQSIESVTEALGGQPLEFYERDLPQIAAAETARRVRADVVVLLLDNGEGLMEVSGGVGLTPAERRLNVEYGRDVMRELFRAGVGLIEDTDRVRGALAGIPGSRAETLVMVPLVHERLGFGVLMAGRNRSQTGVPTEVFSDAEIEVLMGFADAAAASLRTAVLLRHLKGQLRALEDEG